MYGAGSAWAYLSKRLVSGGRDECHAMSPLFGPLEIVSVKIALGSEVDVNVMESAQSIGLVAGGQGEIVGTIEEAVVLATLADFGAAHPECGDLVAEAAARVRLGRDAGSERLDPQTLKNPSAHPVTVQLRYRSEMAEMFIDLAIEVGLRDAARTADVPS